MYLHADWNFEYRSDSIESPTGMCIKNWPSSRKLQNKKYDIKIMFHPVPSFFVVCPLRPFLQISFADFSTPSFFKEWGPYPLRIFLMFPILFIYLLKICTMTNQTSNTMQKNKIFSFYFSLKMKLIDSQWFLLLTAVDVPLHFKIFLDVGCISLTPVSEIQHAGHYLCRECFDVVQLLMT